MPIDDFENHDQKDSNEQQSNLENAPSPFHNIVENEGDIAPSPEIYGQDYADLNTSLPYNLAAEKALFGAILLDAEVFSRVSEFLRAEHFATNAHQRIFKQMLSLENRQRIINEVTLANFFKTDSDMISLGGLEYLAELVDSAVSAYSAENYAQIIYDCHIRRQLVEIGREVSERACATAAEGKGEEEIASAEAMLYNLSEKGSFRSGFMEFSKSVGMALEMAHRAMSRKGSLAGITSGINSIDRLFGGLQRSDLIIVAGRPAMGKTALAANIAWSAATKAYAELHAGGKIEAGAVVGFFSLEMSYDQLALRILSQETGISSQDIRRGNIDDTQYESLYSTGAQLENIPFFIDDTPGQTIDTIRSRARRLKRQHKLGLVIVDYIQLISGSSRTDNRVQEVAEVTRGLKNLAKELEVPVIALSQLSRQVENRDNKRPQMADLRESGSIEQDADIIMFVYRREYYLDRDKPNDDAPAEEHDRWESRLENARNKGTIIVGKNRHGSTTDIELYFDKERTKFSDLERHFTYDDIH